MGTGEGTEIWTERGTEEGRKSYLLEYRPMSNNTNTCSGTRLMMNTYPPQADTWGGREGGKKGSQLIIVTAVEESLISFPTRKGFNIGIV